MIRVVTSGQPASIPQRVDDYRQRCRWDGPTACKPGRLGQRTGLKETPDAPRFEAQEVSDVASRKWTLHSESSSWSRCLDETHKRESLEDRSVFSDLIYDAGRRMRTANAAAKKSWKLITTRRFWPVSRTDFRTIHS
jgi:hypothetical protein